MRDITDAIDRKTFLEVCMDIERLCADLYHFYSKLYEDNPEAAQLWEKTAVEEENHEMQFGLALRLMGEAEFIVSKSNMKKAYTIQYMLQKLINSFKTDKPDLKTAVSKAVEMEEILADLHVNSSLYFREESMQKLFKALSDADRGHVTDLQRYLTVLTLPQCEMSGL